MSARPLYKGDVCEVIGAVGRGLSPHLGKQVTVESSQGDHSTLGPIWRCSGIDLTSYNDMSFADGSIDFAAAWLRRIDPDIPPVSSVLNLESMA